MQNKLVFLITLSFVLVLQTTSTDSSSRKTTSSGKTNKDDSQVVSTTTTLKKKTSRLDDDDDDSYNSNNRQDRFSSFGSSSKNNYRSRARGQSSYSDYNDYNDLQEWSPYGMSSNYPGPLPPSAYETGPYLSNGPNCFPLLDPQYPFFSDLCGAVPQARYALPNAFGHIERWQIAQVLSAILSPISPAANNPICTRSLRLLLCPLLFPPCPTKYEPPPVLPCQPYCRVVKTQCAAPGLELLPCDLLPPTSDLCPINPTPYSSLLSSFIPPPPVGGPGFPPVLPPGALSSLLAQSAMASGLSPFGFAGAPSGASPFGFPGAPSGASPFGFPGAPLGASPFGFPGAPAIGPSSPGATGATSGAVPSPTDPAAAAASASAASPPGAISPSPFPSVLPPVPFSSSMGLADPASSQFSSMLAQSGFGSGLPPPGLASRFGGPGLPPPGLASLFSASGMGPGGMLSPMNSLFGAQSLMSDSLTPILVDFPPISMAPSLSSVTSRFFPRLRSATEET